VSSLSGVSIGHRLMGVSSTKRPSLSWLLLTTKPALPALGLSLATSASATANIQGLARAGFPSRRTHRHWRVRCGGLRGGGTTRAGWRCGALGSAPLPPPDASKIWGCPARPASLHSPWIPTMIRCALLTAALAATALPSAAQLQRNFPATALRGELLLTQPPEALLNNRPARLAPAARIRGADQMLVLSGALVGAPLLVNYTLDTTGLVLDVWVLTPAEAARKPWPVTPEQAQTWRFNPDAQTWTRP